MKVRFAVVGQLPGPMTLLKGREFDLPAPPRVDEYVSYEDGEGIERELCVRTVIWVLDPREVEAMPEEPSAYVVLGDRRR